MTKSDALLQRKSPDVRTDDGRFSSDGRFGLEENDSTRVRSHSIAQVAVLNSCYALIK